MAEIDATSDGRDARDATKDAGPSRAVQIAVGAAHACALDQQGLVRCWGSNEFGQVGGPPGPDQRTPRLVAGIFSATQVATGSYHSCAVLRDRSVRCWGRNDEGLLGDGTLLPRNEPVSVVDLRNDAVQISLGGYHSCARLSAGDVKCWGVNDFGQLGAASPHLSPRPIALGGGTIGGTTGGSSKVRQIACGDQHTCAVLENDLVWCWGWNTRGQLGDGTTSSGATPRQSTSSLSFRVAPSVYHTCALVASRAVECWGENALGQLGDGTVTARTTARAVTGLAHVEAIAGGTHHTCVLLVDHTVRCWGLGSDGELGDSGVTSRTTPIEPLGLGPTAEVAVGGHTTCALLVSGELRCFGKNDHGQLGNGSADARRLTASAVLW